MEGAVIGDEFLMVAGEAPELVETPERRIARVLDRFRNAGRLQRETKPQNVARIRERDRVDAIALARLHGHQMLARKPEQRLAYRMAAHRIAFGELLFAHIITRCQPAGKNISTQAFVDIIA